MPERLTTLRAALVDRYAVKRELGHGGMAIVYLAEDLKHRRPVAIKVLKAELALAVGPERFLREIEISARLHHPHILPLYDSGRAAGFLYYVMPWIEGESLRDRLQREKQLSVEDAVRIAREVADALSYAHGRGVVHRDIKPENILLEAGHAMVADFGIARAIDLAASDRLTETGLAVGTPAYMSPEQGAGDRALDGRSDLYSVACVLYEMLAGKPPFTGPTAESLIRQHLASPAPPITGIRPSVPAWVAAALDRALAKTPADRFASAQQFLAMLEGGGLPGTAPVLTPSRAQRSSLLARSALTAAVALAALVGVLLWRTLRQDRVPTLVPATFVVPLPTGDTLADGLAVAISPDGTRFVYAVRSGRSTQLHSRPINQIASVPLPGTEGATHPLFSPDGRWIAFLADDYLKRIPSSGGQSVSIARTYGEFTGASWGMNDTILFAQRGPPRGIFRVGANGGEPELVVAPATGESSFWWPSRISERVILFGVTRGRAFDPTRIEVLRLDTRERRILVEEGNHPRYAPSGHVLFAGRASYRDNTTIRAVRFDVSRLELRGSPWTVLEDVAFVPWVRAAQFDFSRNGSLLYVSRRTGRGTNALLWVNRAGKGEAIGFLPPGGYATSLMIAPDGRRVVVTSARDSLKTWVVDLERQTTSAFAPGPYNNHIGVWWPNGDQIVFASDREDGAHNLYTQSPGATGPAVRLTHSPQHQDPGSWSPDGQVLVFAEEHPETSWDIWLLGMGSRPPTARPLIRSPPDEHSPAISPDGRWIAYTSTESGRPEVYVERFPQLGAKQQASREGGDEPLWSRNGTELFYTTGQQGTTCPNSTSPEVCVWRVAVDTGTDLRLGRPEVLFVGGSNAGRGFGRPRYDVSADGQHFLIMREGRPSPGGTEFVVTLNWFAELSRRLPAGLPTSP